MKALICRSPGEFEYVEKKAPLSKSGNVILKIKRVGICGTDLHAYQGTQPYFNYPRILGHELSGDIVDTGGVYDLIAGSPAAIIPYFNCGTCIACRNNKPNCCVNIQVCGVHIDGGLCDYLSVPSYSLLHHANLDYDSLAVLEPLSIAAHGIRRAGVKPGEFVLVIGAGPIGLATMQFAQIAGAEVIAMDVIKSRLQFAGKLNIKHTINATTANVSEQLLDITNGDMPTVVIDATGNQQSINNALMYLAHGGRYVLIGIQKNAISFSHPEFHKLETTLMSSRNATRDDFNRVIACVKEKLIDPAVYITHRAKFAELKNVFESWLDPANGVVKAMVEFN
jgi:2-desacetyl-2-hydroxyethyl bacteriochlorophyllide A dehydrogenase